MEHNVDKEREAWVFDFSNVRRRFNRVYWTAEIQISCWKYSSAKCWSDGIGNQIGLRGAHSLP